jgi:lipopolysaccharide export system protein LptA
MKRPTLLVALGCLVSVWSLMATAVEQKPRQTLKIRADSNGVKVEMPHATATAQELIYDQDHQSLLLSGSREKPVRVIQDQPYNKQMALIGTQFTISLETGSVRSVPPESPPAEPRFDQGFGR